MSCPLESCLESCPFRTESSVHHIHLRKPVLINENTTINFKCKSANLLECHAYEMITYGYGSYRCQLMSLAQLRFAQIGKT